MKTKSIFRVNVCVIVSLFALVGLMLTSCQKSLPDSMEGKWRGNISSLNGVDLPEQFKKAVATFDFKRDNSADGGTVATKMLLDFDVTNEGVVMTGRMSFSVSGKWKVDESKLVIKNDQSSLKIDLDKFDVKVSDDVDPDTRAAMETELSMYSKKELEDMFLGPAKESMEAGIENEETKTVTYTDVKIDGDKLSFTCDDGTDMKLTKVDD